MGHRCRNRGSRFSGPRPASGASAGPSHSRNPGRDRREAGRRAGGGADPPSGGAPCRRSRAPNARPRRPRRRRPPRPAAAWAAWTGRPRREHSGGGDSRQDRAAGHRAVIPVRGRVDRTSLAPASDAVSTRGRPLPSSRAYVTGAEADLGARSAGAGVGGRRRTLRRRDRGAARGAARREHPRAAHPVVHRGAGDGRDAHRRRRRQRGDRAVVHVRLDRQRVRPPRRHAGLRGHRSGNAHARPGGGRGGGHAGDRGRRSRPLRGGRVPDGVRSPTPPNVTGSSSSRMRRTASAPRSTVERSARSGRWARSASTTPRTCPRARAGRC